MKRSEFQVLSFAQAIGLTVLLAGCAGSQDALNESETNLTGMKPPTSEGSMLDIFAGRMGGLVYTPAEECSSNCGPRGNSGGNSSGGGWPPPQFDSVMPAQCAPLPTTEFAINQRIFEIRASSSSTKGEVVLQEISGIKPGYVLNDLRSAGQNVGPLTIVASTTDTVSHRTTVIVNEATKNLSVGQSSSSSLANIHFQIAQLLPTCSVTGISPLFIFGRNFPLAGGEDGFQLKVSVEDLRTSDTTDTCDAFVLGGADYRWTDQSASNFVIPGYQKTDSLWGQACGGSATTPAVACADRSVRCNCVGQVKPSLGCGNSNSIDGRYATLTIGATYHGSATASRVFQYGARQQNGVIPKMEYVCVTRKADWDAGLMDSTCIPHGSGALGVAGNIRARTGDILTIVGTNFERLNSPPECPVSDPMCSRKRHAIAAKVAVGGVDVGSGVEKKFALVNLRDRRDGNCTLDNAAGGGVCQRIHVVVPTIAVRKIPSFVGVTLQNTTLDMDEYGGRPALGVSGDPSEQKIKYYGGSSDQDPPDSILPPPVAIRSVVPRPAGGMDVSFEEVGDDPAGFPNAGIPVSRYTLKRSGSEITTDSQFNNAISYYGTLFGHDPAVRDAAGHLPPWQTVSFIDLNPGTRYCFSAKATDQQGNVSMLRVPAGDGGPDGVFCAMTNVIPPPDTAPCPIALSAEKGDDPAHQIRLNWLDVAENGWDGVSHSCVNPSGGAVGELILKYKQGTTDFANSGFGDKQNNSLNLVLYDQEDNGSSPLQPKIPGLNHSVQISGLADGTSFIFAIRSRDAAGHLSEVSNHAVISTDIVITPTPVGSGQFVDLSANLPKTTNVENSVQILPDMMGGHPWMVLADPSAGVQILKVADSYNVDCHDTLGAVDAACTLTFDMLPFGSGWRGDGQPDFLDRDRHVLRTGPSDCDGLNALSQPLSPSYVQSNQLWNQVDSFTACNLPPHPVYGKNVYNASQVFVGRVNADSMDDLVMANLSATGVPDVVYINSGQDLCPTRPGGGQDVADGIPCFLSPVELEPQLSGQKLPSARVKLYDAIDEMGVGADLVVVMTGARQPGGFSIYSNGCKSKSGACQPSDFRLETNLIDVGSATSLLPIHCEDVTFAYLNGDNVRDMICVRSEFDNTANNNGVNLTFAGVDPATTSDGLPHFVLNQSLLAAATNLNCNGSFAATARDPNSSNDYILLGYRKLGGQTGGQGSSCKTRMFYGSNGSFSELTLPGMSNQNNCHNGVVADSRGLHRMDVALACGQLEDLSADFGGDPLFRGMRIFLNNGANSFADFEANGTKLFLPQRTNPSDPNSAPLLPLRPGAPLVFDDVNVPGAATAVGIGDLDNDGIPDFYFGNGATAVGGSALDRAFRQMKQ